MTNYPTTTAVAENPEKIRDLESFIKECASLPGIREIVARYSPEIQNLFHLGKDDVSVIPVLTAHKEFRKMVTEFMELPAFRELHAEYVHVPEVEQLMKDIDPGLQEQFTLKVNDSEISEVVAEAVAETADEAHEVLADIFNVPEVKKLVSDAPSEVQTVIASAIANPESLAEVVDRRDVKKIIAAATNVPKVQELLLKAGKKVQDFIVDEVDVAKVDRLIKKAVDKPNEEIKKFLRDVLNNPDAEKILAHASELARRKITGLATVPDLLSEVADDPEVQEFFAAAATIPEIQQSFAKVGEIAKEKIADAVASSEEK